MAEAENLWRIKKEDGSWIGTQPVLKLSAVQEHMGIRALYREYVFPDLAGSFKRLRLQAGENVSFLLDHIVTGEKVCVYTDFSLENKKGELWCNVADKNKLVFREGETAMKHFRLGCRLDGLDVTSSAGLLMPSKIGTNREFFYAMYEGLHGFGQEHISCFGCCRADSERILKWHLKADETGYVIEPSDHREGWKFCVNLPAVTVESLRSPEQKMTVYMQAEGKE